MATTPETEENKQIVRRMLDEVVTEGNTDIIDDLFAEDVLDHTLMGDTRGRGPIKERAESLHTGFSDFTATVEMLIAERDTVALWAIDRGTHDGRFMGIEPTGQEVEYPATAFFRIEDGRIAERWVQPDIFGLMQQLGVIEPPGDPSSQGTTETVTSADGTSIAYERTGSGPPLVLVHGAGDVHEFWGVAGTQSAFADHFTVYAIDRRGRGESGDTDAYALEREAEDVATVVDAIGEPVVLLGHSSGAIYTLEAALRTDNLQKLILHEPPIAVGEEVLESEEVVAEIQRLLAAGENERALLLFRREIAGLTSEETDELRSTPIWQDMVDAAHTLPRELETVPEYEFDPARFADMATPTLVLSGSESPPFFRDTAETVADAFPNGRLAIIDGHGHEVMNTAPDRFVDEVLMFVREAN